VSLVMATVWLGAVVSRMRDLNELERGEWHRLSPLVVRLRQSDRDRGARAVPNSMEPPWAAPAIPLPPTPPRSWPV